MPSPVKPLLAALLVLASLALAPAALAETTIVARDVSLRSTRSLASAPPPRFDMVGLHWQGTGTPLFRTRSVGGRWSAWLAADDDWGRDGRWRKGAAEWTGTANAIQYRLRGRVTRLRAYFLWSPVERLPLRRLSIADAPPIIPRLSWGADESIRRAAPQIADTLRFALVHHTVNTNDYTPAQSAAIVRGIEVYHVKGNGWNDIGYNFLVDKYGQVFEGRYGGVDRNVVGAHSEGFNTGSVGVAVIGTYNSVGISAAARASLVKLLAWRLDLAHVDPLSTLNVISGGNSRFPGGLPVFLRAISGHRDTYFTDCPGDALYAQIPAIAHDVAAAGTPKLYAPLATGKVGGAVRFTARLTSPLPWTVTVASQTGAPVASGAGTGPTVDWTWDATVAPPGRYSWTIAAGATVRPASGVLGGKLPPLAVTGLLATPAAISPNGDGIDDSANVSYSLAVGARVVASLVDALGATVTPLFDEQQPAGPHTFTFSAAPQVADGNYRIALALATADGQTAQASLPIAVDRTVTAFALSAPAFSPNDDGAQDVLSFAFTLAQPARVRLAVTHGTTEVGLVTDQTYPAGAATASWLGIPDGVRVPDGRYSAALTVGAVTRALPFAVDTLPPRLRLVSRGLRRFATSEPATVVLGKTTVAVARAGTFTLPLRTLPRTFRLTARDAAGNVGSLRVG